VTAAAQVHRTREKVQEEYGEQKWPAMLELIGREIEAEPDAGLARTLYRCAASWWRRPAGGWDPLSPRDFVVDGATVKLPLGGAYGAAQTIILDAVADATEADTDLVIEMGSGWGWHILTAFTTGGPRDATYVAAEYTEAGRDCAARLAQLDEHLKFQAIRFDYHEPSFAGLPKARHAVVFSAHSIEQIPHVKPALFEAICSVAERVTVVQFEPVGWQVGPEHDGRGTSSSYADAHDYTRNYVPALREAEAAGTVVIDSIVVDVFGINPSNSTTALKWRKA
jgi:hypothetical protein